MYTILYVAVLYMAWTNSTRSTTVYNIKAKLLRRYPIVRERERERRTCDEKGEKWIYLFTKCCGGGRACSWCCRHGLQDEGQHNGRCTVLVLLLHQHGVSQKLDGSLVLMWRSVTQTPRIKMTGLCTHGTHRLNQHHMALTGLLYGCYSLAQLDRSALVLLWLCSL